MVQMKKQSYQFFLVFSFSLSFYAALVTAQNCTVNRTALFHVGVVLDLDSADGKVAWRCISMASSDFYAVHRRYSSRLVLHLRDSKGDAVTAASAAIDLIKNVGVQAIIGPQSSEEADFLAKLGDKAHVPVISFSAISSSLSPTRFPYVVRFAQNDSSQFHAIADILKAYGFKEVSLIHDDSHSGIAAIPYLIDALQDIGAQVRHRTALPYNAKRAVIKNILRELEGTNAGVFIIHVSFSLGTRFFKEAGMMKSKHVWIVTSGFTELMSYMDTSILSSMKDVIGVKTHVPSSRAHRKFIACCRKQFRKDNEKLELTVYALWAYDATFAMAMAVNKSSFGSSTNLFWSCGLQHSIVSCNSTSFFNMGFSQMGLKVLKSILATRFTGLSGEIKIVAGQLQSSSFEIVNVTEKGHRIGYWSPRDFLFWSMSSKGMGKTYFANANNLDAIQSRRVQETKLSDKLLKIGVPVKAMFPEFISFTRTSNVHKPNVTGFAQEVFDDVMKKLSYSGRYEYVPFEDEYGNPRGSYNSLIYEVYLKRFDAVVGDITILESRLKYVDFTRPYTISGVRFVVRKEKDDVKDLWWFVKPLTTELWFTTIAFFIFKGILVWIFEHGRNPEFQGSPSQQVGKILTYSFSILVFAHKEKLESNYSRFVVNLWIIAVFILVSSYTANLTSILTVEKLRQNNTNIETLIRSRKYVGYQGGSFVFDYMKNLGFEESRLVKLSTPAEYENALPNVIVYAIFDEIPYLKVLLHKYCHQFEVVGPTYRPSGFGFVFPKNSPMLPNVSNAILNLIKEKKMDDIENKWLGLGSCHDPLTANVTSNRVQLYSFRNIYIIVGMASILALILFFISFVYKTIRDVILRKIFEGRALWWRALFTSMHNNKKEPFQDNGHPRRGANCNSLGSINS